MKIVTAFLFLVSVSAACNSTSSPVRAPHADGAIAWTQLERALPGTWTRPGKDGRPFIVNFQLISGDSALVERWGVGSGHETMTVIHPDRDDLVLTHYCAQGNQPRLRLAEVTSDAIVFRYADATNVLAGQAVLVEQRLRLEGDGVLEDTETYRQPDGKPEITTYRLTKESAPAGAP